MTEREKNKEGTIQAAVARRSRLYGHWNNYMIDRFSEGRNSSTKKNVSLTLIHQRRQPERPKPVRSAGHAGGKVGTCQCGSRPRVNKDVTPKDDVAEEPRMSQFRGAQVIAPDCNQPVHPPPTREESFDFAIAHIRESPRVVSSTGTSLLSSKNEADNELGETSIITRLGNPTTFSFRPRNPESTLSKA
ncbi:hypothetical protein KM043_002311 [Ampulex compressa]|nr:hypothetical protein KM043_002311 [Ampulex compressa]